MKNYIYSGHTLTVVLAAAITSGEGLLTGNLFGVAATSGAIGDEVEFDTVGVFELPKASADEPGQFDIAYWDVSAEAVTTTAAGNYRIGVFTKAYASGSTTAEVRLDGISTVAEPAV